MPFTNPYHGLAPDTAWLRGNLHTHSTRSDGSAAPQAVIDGFASRGYDFLMLSDHDLVSGPDVYGPLNARGMTLIPGNEITANGPHMLHVNAAARIEPDTDRQKVLDAVSADNGGSAFAVVNHPCWGGNFDHCSLENMRRWTGYTAMEIYNGVVARLDGSPYAAWKWDILLSEGRRIWGMANDDMHDPSKDMTLGWSMVATNDRSVGGIVTALREGRFYASTGVTIQSIDAQPDRIRVRTRDAQRIIAIGKGGKRIKHVDGDQIELHLFELPAGSTYVRFECWGAGEKFAWTQPAWITA